MYDSILINTELGEYPVTVALNDAILVIENQGKSDDMVAASPNPFDESTSIDFKLQSSKSARIEVLDMDGRSIALLFEGISDAGKHQINWPGTDNTGNPVKNGIYFVKLTSGNDIKLIKVVKMK
jgi:flagellar hook assembly protein FlgD